MIILYYYSSFIHKLWTSYIYILSLFFAILFGLSFIRLKFSNGPITISFFSSHFYTYDSENYYSLRLLVSLFLGNVHVFSSTLIRRYRSLNATLVLIGSYIVIFNFSISIKSLPFATISFFLLILWIACLYKLQQFVEFKTAFWEEYNKKELDPFCLLKDPPTSASSDLDEEKSFYESYGNELIDPIKVDTKKLAASKKKEETSSPPKRYF